MKIYYILIIIDLINNNYLNQYNTFILIGI